MKNRIQQVYDRELDLRKLSKSERNKYIKYLNEMHKRRHKYIKQLGEMI